MSYSHITDSTATQVIDTACKKAIVQVNAALTGSITIYDATSGTSNTVAIITNPGVGSKYEYWDFQNGVRVVASGTCDITVSATGSPAH